jgi:hypothetical protein
MQVVDYTYYEGTLVVGIHTPRLNPTPATIFLAGGIHAELVAKVRSALREYRTTHQLASGLQAHLPTQAGFPLYGIRKVQNAGAPRSVDEDFNIEVTAQRFTIGLALLESTFTAADEVSHAFERHVEAATQALFAARGVPDSQTMIPGDNKQIGETYIDIMFELGPALEQGVVDVVV